MKAVIIGFSHMHVNEIALYIHQHSAFELVAAADMPMVGEKIPPFRYTPQWNCENIRKNYCSNIYEDWIEMLDTEKPDIAFILTENAQKPQAVAQCACRGIDVSVEKPLAASLEEAKQIENDVKKYGICAVVNWPVIWRDYLHRLKAVADSGVVGDIVKMHYLNGHTGPLGKGARHRGVAENAEEMTDADRSKTWWHQAERGGGVFLDIACYGCFFSEWFLGCADKAMATGMNLNTPFGDTADNYAAVLSYHDKMSVVEGTWTTPRAVIPAGPTLYGTDGVIVCTGGAENQPNVKVYDIYGSELEIPENNDTVYHNMPELYAAYKAGKASLYPMVTLEENMKIMAMLDGLIKSAQSRKEEKICE